MLNIVTALSIEAMPIIKKFKLKNFNGIYTNDKINLIITGSGKLKSAINTAIFLDKFRNKTINFGLAGSSKFDIGEGFFISKIVDTDTGFNYYSDFFYNPTTLYCVSKPNRYYSLVDMESSGFFEAAYKFLTVEKIILYKIVSDTPKTPFNLDIVEDLINKHLEVIDEFIEEEENFFEDVKEYLKEVENKMKLSFSQKHFLKDRLIFFKLNSIPFPSIKEAKTKKEVKEFLSIFDDI